MKCLLYQCRKAEYLKNEQIAQNHNRPERNYPTRGWSQNKTKLITFFFSRTFQKYQWHYSFRTSSVLYEVRRCLALRRVIFHVDYTEYKSFFFAQ